VVLKSTCVKGNPRLSVSESLQWFARVRNYLLSKTPEKFTVAAFWTRYVHGLLKCELHKADKMCGQLQDVWPAFQVTCQVPLCMEACVPLTCCSLVVGGICEISGWTLHWSRSNKQTTSATMRVDPVISCCPLGTLHAICTNF